MGDMLFNVVYALGFISIFVLSFCIMDGIITAAYKYIPPFHRFIDRCFDELSDNDKYYDDEDYDQEDY